MELAAAGEELLIRRHGRPVRAAAACRAAIMIARWDRR
jgi:hypothetical protein